MATLMLRRSPQGYAPVRVALTQMGKQVKLGKNIPKDIVCLLLTLLEHPADRGHTQKRGRDFKMFHADFNFCDFLYRV